MANIMMFKDEKWCIFCYPNKGYRKEQAIRAYVKKIRIIIKIYSNGNIKDSA